MKSLVGMSPNKVLPHGASKIYVDEFLWYSPKIGVITSYTAKEKDVYDHFGVFRAVDQIESFGQATIVASNAFSACVKNNISFSELYEKYSFFFLSIGEVKSNSIIKLGDTFICIGLFVFNKFKQMEVNGRLYRCPENINLDSYFKDYTDEQVKSYELNSGFELVSEFKKLIGKGVKKEYLINPKT